MSIRGFAGITILEASEAEGWVRLSTPRGKMRAERIRGEAFPDGELVCAYTVQLEGEYEDLHDPATWLSGHFVHSRSVGREELARWGVAAAPLVLGMLTPGSALVELAAYDLACDVLVGGSPEARIGWSRWQLRETQWALEVTSQAIKAQGVEHVPKIQLQLARTHVVHQLNLWRLEDEVLSRNEIAQLLLVELADQEWPDLEELRACVLNSCAEA